MKSKKRAPLDQTPPQIWGAIRPATWAGSGFEHGSSISVTPAIRLSGNTISEAAAIDDIIGRLSVVGVSGTPSFTLDDDAGGLFGLDDDILLVADALTDGAYDIEVAVSGVTPTIPNQIFTITVTDVPEDDSTEFVGPDYAGPDYIGPGYY